MKRLLNTLFVSTQGAWLSLEGENIVVNLDKATSKQFPVHLFESVVCFGRVNATSPLMGFCAKKGVHISFFSEHGRFLARVDGPVRGNVLLRRQQYRLADDEKAASEIARNVLIGKIANGRSVLMRAARDNGGEGSADIASAVKYLAGTVQDMEKSLPLEILRGKERRLHRPRVHGQGRQALSP